MKNKKMISMALCLVMGSLFGLAIREFFSENLKKFLSRRKSADIYESRRVSCFCDYYGNWPSKSDLFNQVLSIAGICGPFLAKG